MPALIMMDESGDIGYPCLVTETVAEAEFLLNSSGELTRIDLGASYEKYWKVTGNFFCKDNQWLCDKLFTDWDGSGCQPKHFTIKEFQFGEPMFLYI